MAKNRLPSRAYTGSTAQMHGDLERALGTLGSEINSAQSAAESYSPGNASHWSSPAPSTVAEAIDRLAAAYVAAHGGTV